MPNQITIPLSGEQVPIEYFESSAKIFGQLTENEALALIEKIKELEWILEGLRK